MPQNSIDISTVCSAACWPIRSEVSRSHSRCKIDLYRPTIDGISESEIIRNQTYLIMLIGVIKDADIARPIQISLRLFPSNQSINQ